MDSGKVFSELQWTELGGQCSMINLKKWRCFYYILDFVNSVKVSSPIVSMVHAALNGPEVLYKTGSFRNMPVFKLQKTLDTITKIERMLNNI